MTQSTKTRLDPRKLPVQARSAASVEAILEATIQVLLDVGANGGKARLTTTRVAARAGVSVGTLYQYFPNKSALLQAVLRQHLDEVTCAVERACIDYRGLPLAKMATALIVAFLEAKTRRVKTSVALYTVSDDVEGAKMVRQMGLRSHKAIAAMFASSPEPLATAPQLVATMLQGAMFGVSRRLLESGSPEKHLPTLRRELVVLACAYLEACRAAGYNPEGPGNPLS